MITALDSERPVHRGGCSHFPADLKEEFAFIKALFLMITGVENVTAFIRWGREVHVYVFIRESAIKNCARHKIAPEKVGVHYKDSKKDKKPVPYLWLMELRAVTLAKEYLKRRHPDLELNVITWIHSRATSPLAGFWEPDCVVPLPTGFQESSGR